MNEGNPLKWVTQSITMPEKQILIIFVWLRKSCTVALWWVGIYLIHIQDSIVLLGKIHCVVQLALSFTWKMWL